MGRLIVMGGAFGGGNITAAVEFNIWSDPEAARRVLAGSAVPTTLVPLDLTHRILVPLDCLNALARSGPVDSALASLTSPGRAHYRHELGVDALIGHDEVAVAEAIWPGTLDCRSPTVDVECGQGRTCGATIADHRLGGQDQSAGRKIQVAVDLA
ncbi:nucleoside hydrolase [Actinomadura chokoriensis]|uniref:Nucleoside hydrolase n=1 Tax=Actinomadura chokoriensis TaxID=454156 RepID=A0ABV4R9Z0_9ACTN